MTKRLLAALATVVVLGAPALADHKGKIPWVEPAAEGLQKAKLSGKPVMLFFSAEW